MPKSKFFLKSLTVWGAIVGILPGLLAAFGVTIPPDLIADADAWVKLLINGGDQVNEAVGGLMVLVGRWRVGGLDAGLEALSGRGLGAFAPFVVAPMMLVALAGCGFTGAGNFARDAVADYGAQAMDEGLVNAEFFVCQAASVGSVMRRYGASVEKAEAWRALCHRDPEGEIVVPPGS